MAHSGKRLALFDNTEVSCDALRWLPPKLSALHLNAEDKLLSSTAIEKAQAFFKLNPEVDRLLVSEGNASYHVIKLKHPATQQDEFYIVYLGEKHQALIGEGGFGSLRLMQHADKKTWHVLKTKPFAGKSKNGEAPSKAEAHVEIDALTRLSLNLGYFERSGKQSMKLSVGMPLHPGTNLDKFIEDLPQKPYANLLVIAIAIIEALQALHARKELHGDFNPYNIFYHAACGRIELIDFDNCKKLGDYPLGATIYKPGYVVPEDYSNTYDIASEIYCLGVTLGKLFGLSRNDTIYNGFQWAFPFYDENSPDFKNSTYVSCDELRKKLLVFLKRMTDLKPENRPNHDEISAFFKNLLFRHLNPANAARRIALVDVNELITTVDDDKKFAAFIAPLAHMEEVWLVDAKCTLNKKTYEILLDFLTLSHISVRHFIWRANNPNAITLAMTLSAIVKKAPRTIEGMPNAYFFFTEHAFVPQVQENLFKLGVAVITDSKDLPAKITDHIRDTVWMDAIYLQLKNTLERKSEKLAKDYPNNASAEKKRFEIHHVLEVLAHQYEVHDLNIESMQIALSCLEDSILKTATTLIKQLDTFANREAQNNLPCLSPPKSRI